MVTRAGSMAVVALTLLACAPSSQHVRTETSPLRAARGSEGRAADYLIVTPPRFEEALGPLISHREAQGHSVRVLRRSLTSADAIQHAIQQEHTRGGGALKLVLLVGDAAAPGEPQTDRLPTFYQPKLRYQGGSSYRVQSDYPTDAPYAVVNSRRDLAVGRLPVRTIAELRGFIAKLIRYETQPITNTWSRRVVLRAGTADFGAFTDAALERTALSLLSDTVPYDFDLHVTFGKETSSYAAPPNRLGASLIEEANRGALFFAYVGHSGRSQLQSVRFRGWSYPLGGSQEFTEMDIAEGAPVFLSLACDAGAYDMQDGALSISEAAVLNPHGPVAAFASSRVSHPYPNLLYGEAFIDSFLTKRPRTLGEGLLDVKKGMVAGVDVIGELLTTTDTDALKEEHVGLYNLLGDPATRLRYPEKLEVGAGGEAKLGDAITVTIASELEGTAMVTLETRRSVIEQELEPIDDDLPMNEAFEKMAANHQRANDKRLRTKTLSHDGQSELMLAAPSRPGRYVIKAFVTSTDGRRAAAGHAHLRVR